MCCRRSLLWLLFELWVGRVVFFNGCRASCIFARISVAPIDSEMKLMRFERADARSSRGRIPSTAMNSLRAVSSSWPSFPS